MYVVFIVLNHREKLPEILEGMSHLGSHGATVMDSMGSRALDKKAYSMPMIGGLLKGLDGEVAYNNTIFSVLEREEQVDRILEYVKGALAEPGAGIAFALPVTHMCGGELERHIEKRERKQRKKREEADLG